MSLENQPLIASFGGHQHPLSQSEKQRYLDHLAVLEQERDLAVTHSKSLYLQNKLLQDMLSIPHY
jgi:hypothetical protein